MKKKIVSIAAAIVAFVAINASAQNTSNANSSCAPDAKCQTTGVCKKAKSECTSIFAGLNLTDEQQKAIKDIKKPSCKGDSLCKNKKSEYKAKKDEYKAERAKKMKSARAEYLAQLKKILTPEQYQQLLENNFINDAPRHHDKKGFNNGSRHGKKGDFKAKKRDCKGPKCPKADASK